MAHWSQQLQLLEENLVENNTHPDLVTIIVCSAHTVKGQVMFDIDRHPEAERMRLLLEEQKKVGWYFFLMRFWSRKWAGIQCTHLQCLDKKMRVESLRGKAQLAFWEYAHSLFVTYGMWEPSRREATMAHTGVESQPPGEESRMPSAPYVT